RFVRWAGRPGGRARGSRRPAPSLQHVRRGAEGGLGADEKVLGRSSQEEGGGEITPAADNRRLACFTSQLQWNPTVILRLHRKILGFFRRPVNASLALGV